MNDQQTQEHQHVVDSLKRVEATLKELQTAIVDIAVVKSKIESSEETIRNIYNALFNGTDSKGGYFDRVIRLEESVRSIQGIDIENHIIRLEKEKVDLSKFESICSRLALMDKEKVDLKRCEESHNKVSSRLWNLIIPVVSAFIIASGAIIFNNYIVSKSIPPTNIENQTKIMRQLLQEEFESRGISLTKPVANPSIPLIHVPPTSSTVLPPNP